MCYQSLRVNKLIAYYYQGVVSAVLEDSREGMEKLSVLKVEQCENG
jgi:hypothetical protein